MLGNCRNLFKGVTVAVAQRGAATRALSPAMVVRPYRKMKYIVLN